ncbi:MAG: class I SAM-dependent methyltransferase [Epsilonproteobacteria bacterium]|nr:class I SAM-dependent methyltransferase [Campylobacterota bacterium]
MAKTTAFDAHITEYDNWFVRNRFAFLSELNAVKQVLPQVDGVIEIGIGSGIFATPLGIQKGIDPSMAMREKAKQKGIEVLDAVAENLPYADASINGAVMITSICFVDDIYQAINEVYRVLKMNGFLILGFVDKDSPVGKEYLKHKAESMFYNDAVFWGTEELYAILEKTGFRVVDTRQTIFGKVQAVKEIQPAVKGFKKGSFVVIKALKNSGRIL